MSFFSGTKSEVKMAPDYPETTRSRRWLYDLLQSPAPDLPTFQVPGMSDAEKSGYSLLNQYLASPMDTDYQTGLAELRKTVEGGYDPRTSEAYKGFAEASKLEENEMANTLGRRMQISGMAQSTPALAQEGKIRRGYAADRLSLLGQLINTERDRQLAAAPSLMQAADYAAQDPLRKAQAGMALGSLPRQLDTQQEEAVYDTVLQELLFPYTTQAPIAQFLAGLKPSYYVQEGGPSDLQKFTSAVRQVGGAVNATGAVAGQIAPIGDFFSQLLRSPQTQWAGGNSSPGFPTVKGATGDFAYA